jgi:hypothetical protein
MTEDERLAAIGKALAAAENDPLQPACIVRAFLDVEPLVVLGIALPQVTMRAWLTLESQRSPYVTGEWQADAAVRVQALCSAIATISGRPLFAESLIGAVEPAEVFAAEAAVERRVRDSFATFLPLRRKTKPGEKVETAKDPGTGWWIKVVAKLMSDLRMALADVLDTPLPVAFALLAALGTSEGLEPAGENWREREALNKLEAGE